MGNGVVFIRKDLGKIRSKWFGGVGGMELEMALGRES
jgi:hypothetical protein